MVTISLELAFLFIRLADGHDLSASDFEPEDFIENFENNHVLDSLPPKNIYLLNTTLCEDYCKMACWSYVTPLKGCYSP